MRKNFGAKTYLYPMPVLIMGTYDEKGEADLMTAAWGGIYDTNQVFICLSSDHKTTSNIKLHKEFTISVADTEYMKECDYVGIVSLKHEKDKIKKSRFHLSKAEFVNAPLVEELKMCLECRIATLKDDGQTAYLTADIINVNADEKILTDGKIDPSKLRPITYDPVNHKYIELGNVVGLAYKEGLKLK